MCLTMMLVRPGDPAAYAIILPSGENAGVISSPRSLVSCLVLPTSNSGSPPVRYRLAIRLAISNAATIPTRAIVLRRLLVGRVAGPVLTVCALGVTTRGEPCARVSLSEGMYRGEAVGESPDWIRALIAGAVTVVVNSVPPLGVTTVS